MRRLACAALAVASLAAVGCSPQAPEANDFCRDKGGVLSVTDGHGTHLIVCGNKRAYSFD